MALIGRINRESYRKTRRRKRSRTEFRLPERQRITTVEKYARNGYEHILSAQYVDGTRRASRLELYSGKRLAVIELENDSYKITYAHPTPYTRKVVELKFNQRIGTLTWHELEDDGTVGPKQKCTIEEPLLSTAFLLLLFPIGWCILPFRSQLSSISQSWNSLLDSVADAYSER
ncbi:MAG: hypothetical protein K2Y22_06420 [Candidatus Obscuribacterales bacterium]|nr:hypothetical protein [Candidatus Obscuribacterales bacterium]